MPRLSQAHVPFTTVDEAFALARRRVPSTVYARMTSPNVVEAENARVFDDVFFLPRAATVYEHPDLSTTVLGAKVSFPVLLASPGAARILHPDGEIGATAAAGRAGTINVLAMGTGHPLEQVAAAARGPLWQQLYMGRGREGAEELIERAARGGFQALVVTVDLPLSPVPVIPGVHVPGAELSFHNALHYSAEAVRRPRWLAAFVRDNLGSRRLSQADMVPVVSGASPACLQSGELQNKLSATWADFDWIRDLWHGPIVVKGILSADDAKRAVDVGAAAIVVSNHGGTSLHVSPTLRVLPQIAAAVGHDCEVLFDGGVRSGAQAAKALALGARAVMVGRAYLMGLAAAGEAGVEQVLAILRTELEQTLSALGCPSVEALDDSFVEIPRAWPR
jgi:isopentenyl diphosphate isomerase/L-lactate dehydrogenase-like FMN-dependent dehydrogenase